MLSQLRMIRSCCPFMEPVKGGDKSSERHDTATKSSEKIAQSSLQRVARILHSPFAHASNLGNVRVRGAWRGNAPLEKPVNTRPVRTGVKTGANFSLYSTISISSRRQLLRSLALLLVVPFIPLLMKSLTLLVQHETGRRCARAVKRSDSR